MKINENMKASDSCKIQVIIRYDATFKSHTAKLYPLFS
jgi:hypothetical protein